MSASDGNTIKDMLASVWVLSEEFDDLLGPGKGNVRRCYNTDAHAHGDATPALSFHPQTGAWKCHVCEVKGDLFTLLERRKGLKYAAALEYLLRKYKLWDAYLERGAPLKGVYSVSETRKGKIPPILDPYVLSRWREDHARLLVDTEKMDFLAVRYGLSREVVTTYMLAHNYRPGNGRLWTPIWSDRTGPTPKGQMNPILNFRQHDYLRTACKWRHPGQSPKESVPRPPEITMARVRDQDHPEWEPVWGERGGKVLSTKGQGSVYLYPFEVLREQPSLYLVGGEFKALMLIGLGVPAVTFTTGEKSYHPDLLTCFLGKRVRVLMDPDHAGVEAAELLSQLLADAGAYVERGEWTDETRAELPPKGDVTDLLRLCGWNVEALEYLNWIPVERVVEDLPSDVDGVSVLTTKREWSDFTPVTFGQLVDPTKMGIAVKWNGMVAGRGETPYVIPREIKWTCPYGQKHDPPMCRKCRLPKTGYQGTLHVSVDKQMEWVGVAKYTVDQDVRRMSGVHGTCAHPETVVKYTAAEQVILTPPIDFESPDVSFEYATRTAYILQPDKVEVRDNTVYEFGGGLMPNPKNGVFTAAATQYHGTKRDIFHWEFQPDKHDRLSHYMTGDYRERMRRLIHHVREHVVRIYGCDGMVASIMLSYFLPFRFMLDGERNQRLCPAVLIVGDTSVGKSTTTMKLIAHLGAGRFKTMDSKPTLAGLVGGNLPLGGRMVFTWGVLPTSHGGHVAFDEFAKLPEEEIGALTNTISSGVAQRTTVNGDRSTLCHVRLLYLTNPRGRRPLRTIDPAGAAIAVMGTVQDLGRLEYYHIQPELTDTELLLQRHLPEGENPYPDDLARYHLGWAWHAKEYQILFPDMSHFTDQVRATVQEWGHTTMFLKAMAKWKLGRLAAGLAMLTYSTDAEGEKVYVTPDHVEMAVEFLRERYSPWVKSSAEYKAFPVEIKKVLDRTTPYLGLRTLVSMPKWTREDAMDHLPRSEASELILLWTRAGYLHRNGPYFSFAEPRIAELLLAYVGERQAHENLTPQDGYYA